MEAKTYQQNSKRQGGVQVICIHPLFFSIGLLHFGQGLELANILKEKHSHEKKLHCEHVNAQGNKSNNRNIQATSFFFFGLQNVRQMTSG